MIKAHDFIEAAYRLGFRHYVGVPCSFLTPFINYVIDAERLHYISSNNEGDALATAAGIAIGGQAAVVMMQNSGLGNAINPLTSLTYMFRIPVLIITTQRGAPGIQDEPQHELMGQITGALFDMVQIPWAAFPTRQGQIETALQGAMEYMRKEHRPYAFIMQKDTVATHQLNRRSLPDVNAGSGCIRRQFNSDSGILPSRNQALRTIIEHTLESKTVIVSTTGFTSRELFAIADRPNHLYMLGSMGCASALALGLALARPDLAIVIIDGDGAALMRMGNLATVGSYGGTNLSHILLDNEAHDSTGAQATVSSHVQFADIAAACGYASAYSGNDIAMISSLLTDTGGGGPRFAHLKISPGTIAQLPRPAIAPAVLLRRLLSHIGTCFYDE